MNQMGGINMEKEGFAGKAIPGVIQSRQVKW